MATGINHKREVVRKPLSQERLKELLHYDPETGIWTPIKSQGNQKAGSIAGSRKPWKRNEYIGIKVDNVEYQAHQLAWFYMLGEFAEMLDHKDHDGTNNKWNNIRKCNQGQNNANRRLFHNNTSGYQGVVFAKHVKKWRAVIMINRKKIHLGLFENAEAASKKYQQALKEAYGDFARTN